MRDYTGDARMNPLGSLEAGAKRVIRGGALDHDARYVRAACRYRYVPGNRFANLGFRCARVQV